MGFGLGRLTERLESRLREQRGLLRGATAKLDLGKPVLDDSDENTFDDVYDEAPQDEREEELEAELVDNATAAATILWTERRLSAYSGAVGVVRFNP